jgi:hypothetical protein
MDHRDHRHRESFVALYLQSAQWCGILLTLVKEASEPEGAKHLAQTHRRFTRVEPARGKENGRSPTRRPPDLN